MQETRRKRDSLTVSKDIQGAGDIVRRCDHGGCTSPTQVRYGDAELTSKPSVDWLIRAKSAVCGKAYQEEAADLVAAL